MAYSRRSYKGAPVTNALNSTLAANATTINLANAMSGWSTSGTPFFIVVDPGTTKEEKICVIYNNSTSLTVVDPALTSGWTGAVAGRGCDDTTDRQHETGAVVYPVFTALEANQANELVSKYTTNGDIVVHGSTGFKTVATGGSGNNNKVLVADSTVSDGGVKWGQVVEAGIADDAVTAAKIAAGAVGESELAANAVTSGKIANGTIVADDLASNSVTTAKITDANVTTAKIADANVTNAKLDYTTVPQITVSGSAATGGKNGDVWVVV